MKVILQKVNSASVSVDDKIVGQISKGYCLLVGISNDYSEDKLNWMVNKILNLRCFSKGDWGFDTNIKDINGEILIISQFTLFARVNNGAKPDFSKAMKSENAKLIYEKLIEKFKESGLKIQTGQFGAQMKVNLENNGPFTLVLEK